MSMLPVVRKPSQRQQNCRLSRTANVTTKQKLLTLIFLFMLLWLVFGKEVSSHPQNGFGPINLFLDQIKTNDGLLYVDDFPLDGGGGKSRDPYIDQVAMETMDQPYLDQIAMETKGKPYPDTIEMENRDRPDQKTIYHGPSSSSTSKNDRWMRPPIGSSSINRHHIRDPFSYHYHGDYIKDYHMHPGDHFHSSFNDGFYDNLAMASSMSDGDAVDTDERRVSQTRCPPERDLLPCKCQLKGTEIHVKCEGSSLSKIQRGLSALTGSLLKVAELSLVGNSLRHMPPRVFGSLQVNKLFLMNNNLVAISRNSFAGLETSLEHLYIRDPTLYDLPFDTLDNLNNLKTFVLENTIVTEIPRLYSHSKLEFLKIDGSRVSSIPSAAFKLMTKMKKVHLSNGNIREIGESSLEGLVYLKELNLSNNAIEFIHPRAFRTMEVLEEINLSGNRLTDASMAVLAGREIRALKRLDLSYNKIKSLKKGTFVDMKSVERIILAGNSLQSIDAGAFSKLPSLRALDLSNNLLQEVHADIVDLAQNIVHLKVSRNNLSHVSDIKFLARTMPNLLTLDLDDNNLELGHKKSFEGHAKLEVLSLNANEIKELRKGIFQNLPNLKELHLSHNRISSNGDGQIWDLPRIKILDISHNDIEKVSSEFLAGIPMLTTLDVGFNMITEVQKDAFLEVAMLKSLNMSFNKISELPAEVFIGLRDLYELDLSYNELTEIKNNILQGLTSLEYLYTTHNQIMLVDDNAFRDTSKLKELDMSTNIIQSLPANALKQLPSLRRLNLRRNAINSVNNGDLSGLKIVERLDLSNNHIQTLENDAFKDLSVLRDLDVSVNYIQSLHPNMFSTMKLLERLNVSHNFVADLGPNAFLTAKRLRILDLTNNSLTVVGDAVKGLSSLQGLFLSHNYIDKLENTTFIHLPNLNVLYFDNNGLQQFEPGTFNNLTSLVYLDLGSNNLVELNPGSFYSHHSLRELKLNKNQISMIRDNAFRELPSIQSIELQDNVITFIGDQAFDFMPTLKFLNFSKNGLHDVPINVLSKFPALDVLDLSWNFILEIDDRSFSDLEWLTVLMLHHNDLCHLSDASLSKQRALQVLTLHGNQLRRLHLKALGKTIKGLSLLDMSDNPFSCDCELVWLKEYIQREEDQIVETRMAIEKSIRSSDDSRDNGTDWNQQRRPSNVYKSQTRTIVRYRDALLDRAPITSRQMVANPRNNGDKDRFYDRSPLTSTNVNTSDTGLPLDRAPLTSLGHYNRLQDLESLLGENILQHTLGRYEPGEPLPDSSGRSFSTTKGSSSSSGSIASIVELPMPLRRVPVCAGPQKYKGIPITEVPAEAFLCEGRLTGDNRSSSSSTFSAPCTPRYLHSYDISHASIFEAADPDSVSFLDYNDPIVISHLQAAAFPSGSNVSAFLSDMVTPPPLPSPPTTTTTIIVVTTTPSDVDVQVTQQISQKLINNAGAALDYNVVTGDTPTIYAGSSSSSEGEDTERKPSGGLFGSLPSLPSILQTIGSISNLKLPNIGLNMNWANLPIGRFDPGTGLSSKFGYPAETSDSGLGIDGRPPLWIEGPNGLELNPVYVQQGSHPIPSLQNAEPIYPTTLLGPGHSSAPSTFSGEGNRQGYTIKFPDDHYTNKDNNKKNGPNPDTFRFPDDDTSNLDARGQSGFVFPGNRPTGEVFKNSHRNPNVLNQGRPPLPSVINVGPGQNSGTPFLPGLSGNQPNVQHRQSHIIGSRPGVSTVSKVFLNKKHDNPNERVNRPTQWSHPEVINPNSGVSLYQPSEQFKPIYPQWDNDPIKIITPPQAQSQRISGLTAPKIQEDSKKDIDVIANDNEENSHLINNANILSYVDPTGFKENSEVIPFIPELIRKHEDDYDLPLSTEGSASFTTNTNPAIEYPDYDYGSLDIPSSTVSVQAPTTTYPTAIDDSKNHSIQEVIDKAHTVIEPPENHSISSFPVQIEDDDHHSIDDILDLLYAAEQEVAQEQTKYNDTSNLKNVRERHTNATLDRVSDQVDVNYESVDMSEEYPSLDVEIPPLSDYNDNLSHSSHSKLPTETSSSGIYPTGPIDSLPPPSLTPEGILPAARLSPFHETTQEIDKYADLFSTTHSSVELTQRPPTVYGNIKKNNNGFTLSESRGNAEFYGPPNVGEGVSYFKGNLKPEKGFALHLETSAHSNRQDSDRPLLVSPDLAHHQQDGSLTDAAVLPGTSRVTGEIQVNPNSPGNSVSHSLFHHNDKDLFDSIRYGSQQGSQYSLESNQGSPHLSGIGVPSISRVRPASISILDVHQGSHEAHYEYDDAKGNLNAPEPADYSQEILPSLAPALAVPPPPLKAENPHVALRQHQKSEHQESEPHHRFGQQQDSAIQSTLGFQEHGKPQDGTQAMFGTMEGSSNQAPEDAASREDLDWYYNNYYKDYGNTSDIPIGRNNPVVKTSDGLASASRSLGAAAATS